MSFKDISYLQLWLPFHSAEQNSLCNFSRGHYEKYFCDIIFEFGPVIQEEMLFLRLFSILSSVSPFVQWNRTICVFLAK